MGCTLLGGSGDLISKVIAATLIGVVRNIPWLPHIITLFTKSLDLANIVNRIEACVQYEIIQNTG